MGTIDELLERKSVRKFEATPVPDGVLATLLDCAFAAPTAGNQMLYTILDIEDAPTKAALAVLCDHQTFIAAAPVVLVFLADCRRWYDAYRLAGADPRDPGPGDLVLATQDAMVAAQNVVVAAHALGLGACYIGDILENCESVRELLDLDEWVFPATVLILGYPTAQQLARHKPTRFARRYVVQKDRYHRLSDDELRDMFVERDGEFDRYVRAFCGRKYESDFAVEMSRSVGEYLKAYGGEATQVHGAS
ncbi:MAG: nitroreductase family protein [Propionibacteriaceae bacterium]|jgi:nitroreductase|nr:nitroreductase family protein [Propionibacteriaceae bacterium]